MSHESKPAESSPGKDVVETQSAVQMAQPVNVHPSDERISSGADVDLERKQVEAEAEQETQSDLHTTGDYGINESGQLNNVAVEPKMYVEEQSLLVKSPPPTI